MRHIEDTEFYKLLEPLVYATPEGQNWTIRVGYVSDGHSIPKLLRSLAGSPFATKYPKSAWLHDFLCQTKVITRKEADLLYVRAMKAEGANWFQQKRNYAGVRLGVFGNWVSKLWRRDENTNNNASGI